jgi:subtilase family serine protease
VRSQAPATQQPDRVLTGSNPTAVTLLPGHVPAWASAANDAGPAPDSLPVRLSFVLTRSPERQAAFTRLLEDQQNPASPSFHKWLSPQQVGSLYGPTQHDLAAFTAWLASQGFTVAETAPSGIFVTVDASAAAAAKALGTSFHSFRVNGESRLSAATEPSIPSQFAPLVGSISGLSQLAIEPMHHAASLPMSARAGSDDDAPRYTNSGSGRHFITPGDFATLFDLKSVYNAGITGSGQKVAIIGRSRVATTDISEFESATNLTANLPNVVIPTDGVDPGTTGNGDQSEATLDVDRVIGTAPAVQADLVVSGSANGYNGIYVAAQWEVQHLLDPVMNISFGSCELYQGPGGVSLWDTLFAQAASEGISVFVSSADSGAATCEPQFSTPDNFQFRAINYICASSYATCVGATEPADSANPAQYWSSTNGTGLASALSYIPEGAWNEPTATNSSGNTVYVDASGGGGASIFVPKPAWQTGTGVPADGARDVPDVSFPGAAHDGYFACYASGGGDCSKNYFEYFSGTSAAAPAYAAVTALLNQKTSSSQGNLNPLLYRIAASTPAAFHDATPASSGVANCDVTVPSMCNNSTPSPTGLSGGLAGFALTAGYDQATGLGSLDIANFLTAAAVPVHPLAATQLAVSITSSNIASGQTDTLTATLTSTTPGTPSGTVQFYSDGTALGAPVTLTAGTATAATLPFNADGSFLISAVYSGDTTFAAATAPGIPLTVTGAGSITEPSASSNPVLVDTPVSFSATVVPTPGRTPVPTGIVRFYLSSSTKSGYLATEPLVNGTAVTPQFSFPIDNYTLQTFYLGDTVYSPSSNTTLLFTPQKLLTQTQISAAGDLVGLNGSFQFSVTIFDLTPSTTPVATGTIQLYSNGTPLGASFPVTTAGYGVPAQSPAIAFSTAGTYSITAVYSGDANRQPSTSAPFSLTVLSTPASFQIQASSPALSLAAGATTSNTDTITVTPSLGFTGTVNLACSVAYQGTGTPTSPPTCSFDQSSVAIAFNTVTSSATLTIGTTAPHAVKGPASVSSSLYGAPRSRAGSLPGSGLPLGLSLATLILLAAPVSLRRRWRGTLLAVLVVPFLFLSGCGGGGSAPTPTPTPTPVPGTSTGSYTITVTATTTASGAPAAAPVTIALTVK